MRYFKKIVGERIYLSPINKDDAEIYTKWMNDFDVANNIGMFSDTISLTSEQKYFDKLTTEGHNYAIVLKENDTLIGGISLRDIDHLKRRGKVSPIFIGEAENRGKGYGAEALRLICNYAFKVLNLHNIMLLVISSNEAGIACYKKAGFREFGRRREATYKNGEYLDIVYMDILSTEFEEV